MRYVLIVLWMLFGSVTTAMAQVSVGIGIGLPGVSIGINLPVFPELVPVPGYPVYYAPGMNSNYFFYDGMYWVYQGDNWYASSWYNGPWALVGPEAVPLFVLRIPVRYYRSPPEYFRGWSSDAPPRWGDHWGHEWEQRRSGWDRWNHASVPRPAPLPVYQRQYSGDRYPKVEQQQTLRSKNYRYQPRDPVVRQHFQAQAVQKAPAPAQRVQQGAPKQTSPGQQAIQRSNAPPPVKQSGPTTPRPQAPQKAGENAKRLAPTQAPPQKGVQNVQRPVPTQAPPQQRSPAIQEQRQQPQQGAVQRAPQTLRSSPQNIPQGKGASQEPKRGEGPAKDREKGQ